jgi:DNA-binding response OmpR family regulator
MSKSFLLLFFKHNSSFLLDRLPERPDSAPMRLLLCEDNQSLLDMIAAHLRERGFAVDAVASGGEALALAGATGYDAVVLDLGLPDMDGLDVLRALRARATLPTLIVTARDSVAQRIAGLDAGADDYILKPFDLDEFDARLRAVLRRPGLRGSPGVQFGDVTYDASCRAARVGAQAVELTAREATLFEQLMQHGDRIAVRDALAERLFGAGEDVSGNALEAVISRLRRKLASLGSGVRIEALRGIGYRLRRGGADTL